METNSNNNAGSQGGSVDKLDMIYNEVLQLRKDFKSHVNTEDVELKAIRGDINCLKTRTALNKQQTGFITAGISVVVAAAVSFLGYLLGKS